MPLVTCMNLHAEAESAAADFSNAIKARDEVLDSHTPQTCSNTHLAQHVQQLLRFL